MKTRRDLEGSDDMTTNDFMWERGKGEQEAGGVS